MRFLSPNFISGVDSCAMSTVIVDTGILVSLTDSYLEVADLAYELTGFL